MKAAPGRLSTSAVVVRRATNFRKFRELRSLSQAQIARMLDMAHTYIVSIESGKCPISLKTIDRIAATFRLEPSQVLAELDVSITESA